MPVGRVRVSLSRQVEYSIILLQKLAIGTNVQSATGAWRTHLHIYIAADESLEIIVRGSSICLVKSPNEGG
jgi:hypothetical protein